MLASKTLSLLSNTINTTNEDDKMVTIHSQSNHHLISWGLNGPSIITECVI